MAKRFQLHFLWLIKFSGFAEKNIFMLRRATRTNVFGYCVLDSRFKDWRSSLLRSNYIVKRKRSKLIRGCRVDTKSKSRCCRLADMRRESRGAARLFVNNKRSVLREWCSSHDPGALWHLTGGWCRANIRCSPIGAISSSNTKPRIACVLYNTFWPRLVLQWTWLKISS